MYFIVIINNRLTRGGLMKKRLLIPVVMMFVMLFVVSAQAELKDMNDGTVYDTTTQLSWLKNANTAGLMTWDQAVAWAASLNSGSGYAGLTGWRLPTTTQPDASCSDQYDPGPGAGIPSQGYGYNCTGSEMGDLYYTKGITSATPGLFTNMQADTYWSGTVYAPNPTNAWFFYFGVYFGYGDQNDVYKDTGLYAWAVRPGARSTSAATPVPASGTVGLTIIGAAGLMLMYRRRVKSSKT